MSRRYEAGGLIDGTHLIVNLYTLVRSHLYLADGSPNRTYLQEDEVGGWTRFAHVEIGRRVRGAIPADCCRADEGGWFYRTNVAGISVRQALHLAGQRAGTMLWSDRQECEAWGERFHRELVRVWMMTQAEWDAEIAVQVLEGAAR